MGLTLAVVEIGADSAGLWLVAGVVLTGCVLDRCNQFAPTDLVDLLVCVSACVQEQLQALLNVVNMHLRGWLAPAERVAFVLPDLFDLPFDEVAPTVGRSPAAARKLASRARRRMQGVAAVPDADRTRQREISSPSTCSPTPSAFASSTWWSSTTDEPTYAAARVSFG